MQLLLINQNVQDANIFVTSVNSETIPVLYPFSNNTVLPTSIERIGIVFYGSPKIDLFIKAHLETLIRTYNVTTVDFLGCETLQYAEWTNYYNTLLTNTGVRIGASANKTGNLNYGGDWLMESTAQDIKAVYFTAAIANYHTLLDSYRIGVRSANINAFAALKKDGTVVAWGNTSGGGDAAGKDLTNVKTIFATAYAFAALKKDGTVVAWGNAGEGGNAAGKDLTHVKTIFATAYAFAALKTDGTVVTWGDAGLGGDATGKDLTQVKTIFATSGVFAALKKNGTVIAWGNAGAGGDAADKDLTQVKTIFATETAFAALKKDGTVVTWGDAGGGGNAADKDLTQVKTIFAHDDTFAALKNDGTVVTWGASGYGNPIPANVQPLLTDVKFIAGFYPTRNNYLITPDADLSGADLSDADLSGIDLSGANLSGVISGGITFDNTTLLPYGYSIINGYLVQKIIGSPNMNKGVAIVMI
jgi:alpha-tubulin suppressor-like RCC1 family protein